MFGKGILLVEGDAESFLVPEMARSMKNAEFIPYTLDGAGVSICNVAGVDFVPYVYFFGPYGLDLPLAVITDGDKYIGLQREAKNLLKKKGLNRAFKSKLQNAIHDKDLDSVRTMLEEQGSGWFEGLNRGIKIAKYLDREKAEEIRQLYREQKWDLAREELGLIGIFVNDWTLETELLHSGYSEEFVEVYGELGASIAIQNGMRTAITNGQFESVIRRIEESGKGKGRFAQRLADKVDAERIPSYISDAISFVVLRAPPEPTIARSLLSDNGHAEEEE